MLKELGFYRSDYKEVFTRFEQFYDAVDQGSTGNFIFRALLKSDTQIYSNLKLNRYDFEQKMDEYTEDLIREIDQVYHVRRDLRDDTLPTIGPILGAGDYSAFVAGEIVFTEDTSWSTPILEAVDDWKKLEEIGSAKWYHRLLIISEKLLQAATKGGIPYLRGFFSPLDLAHALRGDQIYMDFYDNPEETHQLLNYCADATIKLAEDLGSLVTHYLGSSEYGTWYMDGCINMSEDIACMISPQLYREFAAPHTQKVIDHFGKGFLHCHFGALYLVEELCRLERVKQIWIATDPNQLKPVEQLKELIAKSNNVCLSIDCESFAEIKKNIEIAKEGNIAFCLPVVTHEEAVEVNDFIREHSNI